MSSPAREGSRSVPLPTGSDSAVHLTSATRRRYHGGRRPSRDDSFHSPTVIPPSALDKPSIRKRYHRRRTCSHTSPRRSSTMVTLRDTRFAESRRLDCENCRHLTVVGLHDTGPRFGNGRRVWGEAGIRQLCFSFPRESSGWFRSRTSCYLISVTPPTTGQVGSALNTKSYLTGASCTTYRLVGLVVKASASRAEDPGFESRLRRDFFGVESYQ